MRNPLQDSCLQNPMDGVEPGRAAIHGVTESDTIEATEQQQRKNSKLKVGVTEII